jgi:hypothetical protein
MATETKNPKPAQLLSLMLTALLLPVSAFNPHRHLPGFGSKFFTIGYLIAVWIWFWRSLTRQFGWPPISRFVIPSALFVLPLAYLHTIDKSLGSVPGDYAAAILILLVIGAACAEKIWVAAPSADTVPSAKIEAS